MDQPVLRYVVIFSLIIVISLLVSLLAIRFKKHPNRAKGNKRRVRMPKNIRILTWPVLVVGVLGLLASFAAPSEDAVAMPVAFGVVILVGLYLLFIHRNWYVDAGEDAIEFRTVTNKVHTPAYHEIQSYEVRQQGFQKYLNVRGDKGEKLNFSISQYSVPPLRLPSASICDMAVGRCPASRAEHPPRMARPAHLPPHPLSWGVSQTARAQRGHTFRSSPRSHSAHEHRAPENIRPHRQLDPRQCRPHRTLVLRQRCRRAQEDRRRG